jgi:hypothetical protein
MNDPMHSVTDQLQAVADRLPAIVDRLPSAADLPALIDRLPLAEHLPERLRPAPKRSRPSVLVMVLCGAALGGLVFFLLRRRRPTTPETPYEQSAFVSGNNGDGSMTAANAGAASA